MIKLKFIFLMLGGLVAFQIPLSAQVEIRVISKNPDLDLPKFTHFASDSNAAKKELENLQLKLINNGFLLAGYDSVICSKTNCTGFLNPSLHYVTGTISPGNVDQHALTAAGFKPRNFIDKAYSPRFLGNSIKRILTYYENNGYPFASVSLDSVIIKNETINASLKIHKGRKVIIDSLVIKGDAKVNKRFLTGYLGIDENDQYNESKIRNISSRIKELPFLKETRPFEIQFTETSTKIILFLENRKASQADGVLGFMPDNTTGKINFTGQAHLKLHNSLSKGEIIELDWNKLQPLSQELKSRFNYPYVFSTAFGIEAGLDLFKRDTTYTDVNRIIGIQYLITGNDYLKGYYNFKTSSLLSTKGYEFITTLPSFADISSSLYGLEFQRERLDYRLNPRKGLSFRINAAAGTRTIKKNAAINELAYENVDLSTTQYSSQGIIQGFIPVMQRSVLTMKIQGATLVNSNLFMNELYRLGGLRTIRGFDDNSILASTYGIATMEYRFIFEQNSYMYLFADGAYYENMAFNFNGDRYDTPFGFGAGLTFETKAGIFSINYALGKQFNNPIFLRSAKVHFGIVNHF